MTTMDLPSRMSLTLLCTFGFLLLLEKSYALPFSQNPAMCKYVLNAVCYEFVDGSFGWDEARMSCENQAGNLLMEMSSQQKLFLQNTKKDSDTTELSWWLGARLQSAYKEIREGGNVDITSFSCTYLKLNPLQLVTTANCDERRGFLCTHRIYNGSEQQNSFKWSHRIHSRYRREIINETLDDVERILRGFEQYYGEPSAANRSTVIPKLMNAAQALASPIHNNTVSRILNCTTAVLTLSLTRCNLDSVNNPTPLFEEVFEIFRVVSLAIGADSPYLFVTAHPDGNLYQQRYDVSEIGESILGSREDGEYVVMPSKQALEPIFQGRKDIIAQVTTFRSNPHPTDEPINGCIFSLVLNDPKTAKEIKVENLSENFEIYLPRLNATDVNNTVLLEEGRKAVTSFNITDPHVTVFLTIEPNVNVSLRLLLQHGSPPNSTFNGTQVILNPQVGYRWIITPRMLEGMSGMWYVDARLFNSTWVPNMMLSITSHMTKCLYWDIEDEKWTTDGCEVGPKSTPEITQCFCNHLTLFGSSFFVMPNYVDLSRTAELFATAKDNYVVLALVCAFFGFYFMTLMWACYADRKALSKRKITLLEDNHPGALYNYLVCVHTGHRKNAGTTANVMAKLIGSEGESDTHTLTDPDKPVFERGSVDMFLLATPYPLGELKNLRLQHDNSGGRPSWYINRVIIQDLQTKNVFHFFCDCWLSADKGDGMIKKTFNAAKNNEVASFRNIFTNRTSNGFRDEHIWVSVWDPPSRSPFTRAQRISCCMCLLLCTMAINIAFWNLPVDKNSPVVLSIGFLELTWQEIMVGIQSGLLMFPINILIITIFRSIKPRIIPKKETDEEIMKPPPVSIPTILKETEEMIMMVSQSPRNKMSQSNHLESSTDLCPALENVREFIQLMQGETQSDSHWVYCSKFLLCGLSHLLQCLEKMDAKNFPTTDEYQHLLTTTNLLVRKAEMVFTSHLTYCPPPPKVVKKKHASSCWLPWWCVFLGWFLLFAISGISTYFTLIYGFEYGKDKSTKWVMSLGLSLFQSIFILQPLKVIGFAVFFALLLKPVAMEETEEVEQVLLSQQDKCKRYAGRDI